MADMDFPADPIIGQKYTNSIGVVYEWSGTAWLIGFYDSTTETFTTVGDLLDMIRTLLQDTDVTQRRVPLFERQHRRQHQHGSDRDVPHPARHLPREQV